MFEKQENYKLLLGLFTKALQYKKLNQKQKELAESLEREIKQTIDDIDNVLKSQNYQIPAFTKDFDLPYESFEQAIKIISSIPGNKIGQIAFEIARNNEDTKKFKELLSEAKLAYAVFFNIDKNEEKANPLAEVTSNETLVFMDEKEVEAAIESYNAYVELLKGHPDLESKINDFLKENKITNPEIYKDFLKGNPEVFLEIYYNAFNHEDRFDFLGEHKGDIDRGKNVFDLLFNKKNYKGAIERTNEIREDNFFLIKETLKRKHEAITRDVDYSYMLNKRKQRHLQQKICLIQQVLSGIFYPHKLEKEAKEFIKDTSFYNQDLVQVSNDDTKMEVDKKETLKFLCKQTDDKKEYHFHMQNGQDLEEKPYFIYHIDRKKTFVKDGSNYKECENSNLVKNLIKEDHTDTKIYFIKHIEKNNYGYESLCIIPHNFAEKSIQLNKPLYAYGGQNEWAKDLVFLFSQQKVEKTGNPVGIDTICYGINSVTGEASKAFKYGLGHNFDSFSDFCMPGHDPEGTKPQDSHGMEFYWTTLGKKHDGEQAIYYKLEGLNTSSYNFDRWRSFVRNRPKYLNGEEDKSFEFEQLLRKDSPFFEPAKSIIVGVFKSDNSGIKTPWLQKEENNVICILVKNFSELDIFLEEYSLRFSNNPGSVLYRSSVAIDTNKPITYTF